ncbi:MAG TPA: type 1 periplasmic binding fold superfamily protein [Flavobacteriales bacterium]|nr:type 1 periplasmic binding fold superfamily protein [Flavobacteriales bacterium]
MKNIKHILWALPLLSILFFTSCEKDDPEVPNEEELITTVTYTLTPQGGGSIVQFEFRDLDGDGGSAPVITTGTLAANTTYVGVMSLLNESGSETEDITVEVAEEAAEHQLFYTLNSFGFDGNITYADADINGNPIGLLTNFTVGAPSTASLTITLRHEPDKSATGVSDGDITNAGGETDIQVTFEVTVQ